MKWENCLQEQLDDLNYAATQGGQVGKQLATFVRCPERVKDIFIKTVFTLKQGQTK